MRNPYALVRLGRGVVAATASTLLTGDHVHITEAIALSESVSAVSDIACMMPYFGNALWMLMLWPSFTSMYHELYLFNMKERHLREWRLIAGTIAVLVLYHIKW